MNRKIKTIKSEFACKHLSKTSLKFQLMLHKLKQITRTVHDQQAFRG